MCYWLEDFREAQTIPEEHIWQPYSGSCLRRGFEPWSQLQISGEIHGDDLLIPFRPAALLSG